jgi:hypothetical protein
MLKVAKSSITSEKTQKFEQKTVFAGYPLSYPVRAVKECSYECQVGKVGDYAHAAFVITGTLEVEDSRDGKPFLKKIAVSEDVDILDEEDAAGAGFLVDGSSIDLDELALRIILSSLPIRLVRSEKVSLPKSGPGYRVLSEGEPRAEAEKVGEEVKEGREKPSAKK